MKIQYFTSLVKLKSNISLTCFNENPTLKKIRNEKSSSRRPARKPINETKYKLYATEKHTHGKKNKIKS